MQRDLLTSTVIHQAKDFIANAKTAEAIAFLKEIGISTEDWDEKINNIPTTPIASRLNQFS